MTVTTDSSSPASLPLAVDLDGTLILTDTTWVLMLTLIRRNPFYLIAIFFWAGRGRAFLKQRLASKAALDPAKLPFNEPFLEWLREEKLRRPRLVLATASDQRAAAAIARHLGIFDEVLASDGKTNLRDNAKLRALVQKFGVGAFDYAGNSSADLPVWKGAREAIIVNARPGLERRVTRTANVSRVFPRNFSESQ